MHATAEFNRLTDHQEDGEVRATFTKERLGEFCNRLAKDVQVVWSRSNAPEDLELLAEDRTTLGGLDRKHEVLTATYKLGGPSLWPSALSFKVLLALLAL